MPLLGREIGKWRLTIFKDCGSHWVYCLVSAEHTTQMQKHFRCVRPASSFVDHHVEPALTGAWEQHFRGGDGGRKVRVCFGALEVLNGQAR